MKKAIPIALLALTLVALQPAAAQWRRPTPPLPPGLSGTWFMHGDPNLPTEIIQQPDGTALFINEHGSEAWGEIQGDTVWIPAWSDGWRRGLVGVIRGQRIVWPNGTYWSRWPEGPARRRW